MRLRMLMQVVLLAAAVAASGPVKVGATAAIVDAGRVDIASVSGLAAPRIILSGDAIQLPREAFATTLIYAPPQEIRSRIAEVTWTGGVAGRETDEGWPVQVRLRGTGDYELNLNVRFSGSPGPTGRIPDVDRIITLSVVNVSASSIHAVIDYPGAVATPPVDVNGDFRVDDGDAAGFWETYGGVRGTPEYRSTSDWDGNGTIELADLAQFVDSYQGWKGQEIGPTYGNGRVYPVTGLPNVHGFAVPTPIFQARTEPAGFEPWIQWQVDGSVFQTGPVFTKKFGGQGEHTVAAGVFGANEQDTRDLVIYSARVPEFDGLVIRDGVEYTFTAETSPAGYEDYVNWFSATLYGTVSQPHARGRTYTVRFDNTWGPMPQDPSRQFSWLGAQADNLYLNQDVKGPQITSISPTTGGAGTYITVKGSGFGEEALDFCTVLKLSNGEMVGLEAIAVEDTEMVLFLPDVPPGVNGQPATLMVGRGVATEAEPPTSKVETPLEGLEFDGGFWIWTGDGDVAATAPVPFTLQGAAPENVGGNLWGKLDPATGTLYIDICSPWGAGALVQLTARVFKPGCGYDMAWISNPVKFLAAGNNFQCATLIKNWILASLNYGNPACANQKVQGAVVASPIPGCARIVLSLPGNKQITGGMIHLTVVKCPCISTLFLVDYTGSKDAVWPSIKPEVKRLKKEILKNRACPQSPVSFSYATYQDFPNACHPTPNASDYPYRVHACNKFFSIVLPFAKPNPFMGGDVLEAMTYALTQAEANIPSPLAGCAPLKANCLRRIITIGDAGSREPDLCWAPGTHLSTYNAMNSPAFGSASVNKMYFENCNGTGIPAGINTPLGGMPGLVFAAVGAATNAVGTFGPVGGLKFPANLGNFYTAP